MNNSIYKKGLAVVLIIAIIIMTALGIKLSSKEDDICYSNMDEEELNEYNISCNNDKILKNCEIVVDDSELKKTIIIVDVDGAVENPGVYEFANGDRVNDAIIKSGGLLEKAYTKNINKARLLVDGEKIYIAEEDEENFDIEMNESSIYNMNEIQKKYDKININTASKELLMSLDGIGEVYSQRIIEYRNKIKFSKIEDVKKVTGIGEKTFEKIEKLITIE